MASSSGPRSTTMPTTSTAGTFSSASARSSRYSRRASRSLMDFSAYSSPLSATKRTTCREMPRWRISTSRVVAPSRPAARSQGRREQSRRLVSGRAEHEPHRIACLPGLSPTAPVCPPGRRAGERRQRMRRAPADGTACRTAAPPSPAGRSARATAARTALACSARHQHDDRAAESAAGHPRAAGARPRGPPRRSRRPPARTPRSRRAATRATRSAAARPGPARPSRSSPAVTSTRLFSVTTCRARRASSGSSPPARELSVMSRRDRTPSACAASSHSWRRAA